MFRDVAAEKPVKAPGLNLEIQLIDGAEFPEVTGWI